MTDDGALSPLSAFADLPGAALRLLAPLAAAGLAWLLLGLGMVALLPGAAPRAESPASAGPVAPPVVPTDPARMGGGYMWVTRFGFAQPYGAAQFSPSLPIHRGVDLQVAGAADGGRGLVYTPFQPGVVAAVTSDPFGGNGVIVQLASGLYTRYFHNAAVLVRAGQAVDTSTPLAVLGDTGSPGFPHVHFEVSRGLNGDPVGALIDPRPFMRGGAAP